ncbi:ATP-binding SpoIIE family protein phosphatase [Duganella qianjiadongensis]|uniref:SpoIIE family protein phosphatase n=1 Tax=Duganella qianjiadongensis TaxID=2692176 RepID=A0ABW9VI74_9BURK|nr:SpoIIE family protein phosphatase [Duganella qianjiadongensis]MYM38731.1 SpoIIE family protein phosphatase [Duganella qianjiadongensis]
MLSHFLAPTVWLSSRLSFKRKYALIGAVVLLALALLCTPLLRKVGSDIELARSEREGLVAYRAQAQVLYALVNARSAAVLAPLDRPDWQALDSSMARLMLAEYRGAAQEAAARVRSSWLQVQSIAQSGDRRQRFVALTGSINAVLGLMREDARSHRLNVDGELDATFDMLANRLPLVAETLARQQDALTFSSDDMASYALGAQVVLSESVANLKAGLSQLAALHGPAQRLQQPLSQFLANIARQQDAADKTLDAPASVNELRALATDNLQAARELLEATAGDADEFLAARIARLQQSQIIVALILVAVIAAIAYLFAGIYLSTLRSLRSLSEGTQSFCAGRLDTRIHIDTRDELVLVANNFNTVASEFAGLLEVVREQNESRERELEEQVAARTWELAEKNEALRAAGERVQEELDLARAMQLAILPQHFPAEDDWAVHAAMYPARELGGDFYDCFPLADGRCGVLVADVSGKGVGAAFFMAVSRTVLLDLAMTGDAPARVLAAANDLLCERNPMELFVTACYAIYNPQDGSLVYASAGHPPPLRRSADGTVTALPCMMDVALGWMPALAYTDQHATLAAGEALLLYTDGVTEAFSAAGEAYGDDRLLQWFGSSNESSAAATVASLVRDVACFVNGAEASDDLTCLVLRRKPGVPLMDTTPIVLHNKRLLLEYDLPSRVDEIAQLAEAVNTALPERSDLAFAANLCLEELVTNTIQYGLESAPDRVIHVRMSISDEWLEIILKDDAPPFDPFAEAPAPDLDGDLDARPIGGLGVHLVKTLMDDARAYFDGSGNLIVLLKTLRT